MAALFAVLASACEGPDPSVRPNIVLVTIDTLRADHLGCYGYPRDTSIFIDSLALQGVVFDNAYSSSASTVPSHASMFTGLYPLQHGVRRNGGRLHPTIPTLPALMATAGYETAAFVSSRAHFSPSGLDRGFDHFDEPEGHAAAVRNGPATVAAARGWLDQRKSTSPLFLWVHFFDPHSTLRQVDRHFEGDSEALLQYLFDHQKLDSDFFANNHQTILNLVDGYDGEIREVDESLHKLFRTMEQRLGTSRENLWILTADHGEGLGNHGWLLHGKNIYNEQIKVPLIFYSSAGRFSPRRVQTIVEHVDLVPTLFDLIGAGTAVEIGTSFGESFSTLLEGGERAKEYAFSERRAFKKRKEVAASTQGSAKRKREESIVALLRRAIFDNYEAGEKFSLQGGRYKYILRSEFEDELYDLANDPYEMSNLIGMHPAIEETMRRELISRVRRLRSTPAKPVLQVDKETLKGLQALGYVQ